jgi:NDP-sugar pyrophosphorylase family protein
MDHYHYPSYDHTMHREVIRDAVPLTEHLILHRGQALRFNDFDIVFGDTTKGELKVTRDGMKLEGASVIMAGAVLMGNKIAIGEGVLIESGALIKSPAIIGDQTEIRQGAYLRGYCITGKRCVLGHTTEMKSSILLNDAKAGHFAYLGDSILGNRVNLGAGTKLANLKILPGNIFLIQDGKKIDTGRRKFGAVLGDDCQTGCNSVTSPGTVMDKRGILLPNTTSPSGYHKVKAVIR